MATPHGGSDFDIFFLYQGVDANILHITAVPTMSPAPADTATKAVAALTPHMDAALMGMFYC